MKYLIGMVVAGSAWVSAPPAQAADLKTIGCIEGRIEPKVAARIGDETMSAVFAELKGQAAAPVDMDAESDKLAAIARTCSDDHGWSDEALDAVIGYSVARMSIQAADPMLVAQGIDPANLRKAYDSLPYDTRLAFAASGNVSDDAFTALFAELGEEVVASLSEEQGAHIGAYAAFLSLAETEQGRFFRN